MSTTPRDPESAALERSDDGRGRPPRRRRVGPVLWILMWVGLVGVVVMGAGLAGAEYYTGRPQFCGSCHVMDPYYETWSHDLHGAKLGVKCIDCHYAPGERFTVMAKFKGLSQVASYFSGRYGAGRPRAHVSDASCLRSGCHADGAHRDKLLPLGEPRKEMRLVGDRPTEVVRTPTVHFRHTMHQDIEERMTALQLELSATRRGLQESMSGEAFARLQAAVSAVTPALERQADLRSVLDELRLNESGRAAALNWSDLEHRALRLRQLDGLSCSSCHNFDPSAANHIAVNRQVCFTCHFANEQFNHGTAECLKCHEPPTRAVVVHGSAATASASTVMMDHQDIVRQGIDCASCHFDVVRGDTSVSERECRHCHDQDSFLKDFANRTIETVAGYHAAHVAHQRARCEDCHQAIEHSLVAPEQIATGGKFLEPVRNDCQHCHPGHHSEQVHLLLGTGGRGVDHPMPNAMMGSRLNCRACHTQEGEDFKGDVLVEATAAACVRCHSPEYAQMFEQWQGELGGLVEEVAARLARLDARLSELTTAGATIPEACGELADSARSNLQLVQTGGGLHNKPYAIQLLETARNQLVEADGLLAGVTPPQAN